MITTSKINAKRSVRDTCFGLNTSVLRHHLFPPFCMILPEVGPRAALKGAVSHLGILTSPPLFSICFPWLLSHLLSYESLFFLICFLTPLSCTWRYRTSCSTLSQQYNFIFILYVYLYFLFTFLGHVTFLVTRHHMIRSHDLITWWSHDLITGWSHDHMLLLPYDSPLPNIPTWVTLRCFTYSWILIIPTWVTLRCFTYSWTVSGMTP